MDGIAPISSSLMSAVGGIKAPSRIGVAMLSKELDVQQQTSAKMIKMMEQSVNPMVGSNIDVSA